MSIMEKCQNCKKYTMVLQSILDDDSLIYKCNYCGFKKTKRMPQDKRQIDKDIRKARKLKTKEE